MRESTEAHICDHAPEAYPLMRGIGCGTTIPIRTPTTTTRILVYSRCLRRSRLGACLDNHQRDAISDDDFNNVAHSYLRDRVRNHTIRTSLRQPVHFLATAMSFSHKRAPLFHVPAIRNSAIGRCHSRLASWCGSEGMLPRHVREPNALLKT